MFDKAETYRCINPFCRVETYLAVQHPAFTSCPACQTLGMKGTNSEQKS